MSTKQNIIGTLLIAILAFVLGACSSTSKAPVETVTIQAQSSQQVNYQAKEGAGSYSWKQVSGPEVSIADRSSSTLSFTAPEVTGEMTLVFELEAVINGVVQRTEVRVIVSPADSGGDDNTTAGGNDDNTTTGGGDDDNASTGGDDNVTEPTVSLQSLKLTVAKTSLNKDENTTVKAEATYADNTTKDVTDKVQWVVTPSSAVKVTSSTLTALQDKATTLKAKLNTTLSNSIDLNIIWRVNGHTLPPEPDKALNDSTLLGIDVNNNGVRDDVERWIYNEYKDKHPIHIDIAMQAGRAYKKVLETPEKAKEIHDEVVAAGDCESYYRHCVDDASINAKRILSKEGEIVNKYFRSKVFNTTERKNAYYEYNSLLSGDTYIIPWCSEMKQLCDFDTSKYEE
ncbi:MAG: hypothetical protein ABXS91_03015 [Sulfurimonas sp.]